MLVIVSSHADNLKSNSLKLGERSTFGINVSFGAKTWRSLYTGHVDMHMISKTGGEI